MKIHRADFWIYSPLGIIQVDSIGEESAWWGVVTWTLAFGGWLGFSSTLLSEPVSEHFCASALASQSALTQLPFMNRSLCTSGSGLRSIILVLVWDPSFRYRFEIHHPGNGLRYILLVLVWEPSFWYRFEIHHSGTGLRSIILVGVRDPSFWY